MSKFEKLNVSVREGQGTSFVRRLRLENKVPGVLYHSGLEATSLSIEKNELYKALKTGQFIFEVGATFFDRCHALFEATSRGRPLARHAAGRGNAPLTKEVIKFK